MELLTIQETAAILKVSPITVRRFIKSRRLPAVRVGRALRVRREDVESLPEPANPTETSGTEEDDAHLFTENDPFLKLIGMGGSSDVPYDESTNDVSRDKYKYLAEAYGDLHEKE